METSSRFSLSKRSVAATDGRVRTHSEKPDHLETGIYSLIEHQSPLQLFLGKNQVFLCKLVREMFFHTGQSLFVVGSGDLNMASLTSQKAETISFLVHDHDPDHVKLELGFRSQTDRCTDQT